MTTKNDKSILHQILLIYMKKNLNQNHVTACACTINITCHSTVDGVSVNSVQDRAQAVAMTTNTLSYNLFVNEIPIWMPTPACVRTINITCHTTVDRVPENSVQGGLQAVAIATKHPKI